MIKKNTFNLWVVQKPVMGKIWPRALSFLPSLDLFVLLTWCISSYLIWPFIPLYSHFSPISVSYFAHQQNCVAYRVVFHAVSCLLALLMLLPPAQHVSSLPNSSTRSIPMHLFPLS